MIMAARTEAEVRLLTKRSSFGLTRLLTEFAKSPSGVEDETPARIKSIEELLVRSVKLDT